MIQTFLDKLAEHGLVGALLALALCWVYLKDQEIKAERAAAALALAAAHKESADKLAEANRQLAIEKDARIADAKGFNEVSLRLQGQVITSVQQMSEIYKSLPSLQQLGELQRALPSVLGLLGRHT